MSDNQQREFHPNAPFPSIPFNREVQAAQRQRPRPTSSPPTQAPERSAQLLRVDAQSIVNCMFRFTYIWQTNGNEYWMFPTNLSRNTVSGFRWDRRFGWGFFGVSLDHVESFMCR